MPNRKRRRARVAAPGPPLASEPSVARTRADRKEEARRQREALRRRIRRRQLLRRGAIYGGVVAVIGAIVAVILMNQQRTEALVERAQTAATAAGCSEVQTTPDEGARHIVPGEVPAYRTRPATSGPHNPVPLPREPNVYDTPVPEDQAVHNLEHGYVLVWYRLDGENALAEEVVGALEDAVGGEGEVIMARHAQLPDDTSLALVAWTRLQTCPNTVTADQAVTITEAFISQFRNASSAPEPAAP